MIEKAKGIELLIRFLKNILYLPSQFCTKQYFMWYPITCPLNSAQLYWSQIIVIAPWSNSSKTRLTSNFFDIAAITIIIVVV